MNRVHDLPADVLQSILVVSKNAAFATCDRRLLDATWSCASPVVKLAFVAAKKGVVRMWTSALTFCRDARVLAVCVSRSVAADRLHADVCLAARFGNADFVRLALASVPLTFDLRVPSVLAASGGHLDVVTELVERGGACPATACIAWLAHRHRWIRRGGSGGRLTYAAGIATFCDRWKCHGALRDRWSSILDAVASEADTALLTRVLTSCGCPTRASFPHSTATGGSLPLAVVRWSLHVAGIGDAMKMLHVAIRNGDLLHVQELTRSVCESRVDDVFVDWACSPEPVSLEVLRCLRTRIRHTSASIDAVVMTVLDVRLPRLANFGFLCELCFDRVLSVVGTVVVVDFLRDHGSRNVGELLRMAIVCDREDVVCALLHHPRWQLQRGDAVLAAMSAIECRRLSLLRYVLGAAGGGNPRYLAACMRHAVQHGDEDCICFVLECMSTSADPKAVFGHVRSFVVNFASRYLVSARCFRAMRALCRFVAPLLPPLSRKFTEALLARLEELESVRIPLALRRFVEDNSLCAEDVALAMSCLQVAWSLEDDPD